MDKIWYSISIARVLIKPLKRFTISLRHMKQIKEHYMKNIILVAETGSDITPALADKYGVHLVPMHVSMNNTTYDDGTFPPEDVCAYYDKTGKVPQTSASSPGDFTVAFDEIHEKYPDAKILHLAYSAITTASYQSAVIASENRDYVKSLDTKHVSVGQAAVTFEVAGFLKANPDATLEEAFAEGERIREKVKMCFVPDNLDYLRAGGRVSNAVAIAGNLLHLHPCIDIIDGQLIAKKKYRGAMKKIVPKLIEEYSKANNLSKEHIYFINTPYLTDEIRHIAEETARALGFRSITWMKTGCVITCHGGPRAFGMVGITE